MLIQMSLVSILYLCNFTTLHTYETFFYNVCIAKTTCFYFCLCFHKDFIKGTILRHSIIYEQLNEVICCCLNCSNQISITNFREESGDFFDELKKIMNQYFYVYGRYDNK